MGVHRAGCAPDLFVVFPLCPSASQNSSASVGEVFFDESSAMVRKFTRVTLWSLLHHRLKTRPATKHVLGSRSQRELATPPNAIGSNVLFAKCFEATQTFLRLGLTMCSSRNEARRNSTLHKSSLSFSGQKMLFKRPPGRPSESDRVLPYIHGLRSVHLALSPIRAQLAYLNQPVACAARQHAQKQPGASANGFSRFNTTHEL